MGGRQMTTPTPSEIAALAEIGRLAVEEYRTRYEISPAGFSLDRAQAVEDAIAAYLTSDHPT